MPLALFGIVDAQGRSCCHDNWLSGFAKIASKVHRSADTKRLSVWLRAEQVWSFNPR